MTAVKRAMLAVGLAMSVPVPAPAQTLPADAYRNAGARELVRLARERRSMLDSRIQAYSTTALERISVGVSAGIGERLLYRRETASRIDWTRDTVRIHVLGAREVLPPVQAATQVPAGLSGALPSLAFDPVDSEMLLKLDSADIRHPLAAGSEEHYRFASGDSTTLRLPDGRSVRLLELRIEPRRRSTELISGSFWLDRETHAVVQAYFRLARAYSSAEDPAGDASFLLPELGAELDYIAIEYGLWDLHWWLPRVVAARGVAQFGRFRLPIEFERSYRDYEVTGDTLRTYARDAVPDIAERPCRPRVAFSIQAGIGSAVDTAGARADTIVNQRRPVRAGAGSAAAAAQDTASVCSRPFIVTRGPAVELLDSELLPGTVYSGDAVIVAPAELRAIADRVRSLPVAPWTLQRPVLQLPWSAPGLLRYNRVEGASVGVRALLDLGRLGAAAEARLATAPLEPYGALSLVRRGNRLATGVTGYRRLEAVDIHADPFSAAGSAAALLLGRDDHDYFRATGAELTLRPANARRQWFDLRLYAERQGALAKETDFHLRRALGSDREFRPNLAADAARQAGAVLGLHAAGGLDPEAFRWSAGLELRGEAGDYAFTRPALTVRAGMPLGRLAAGLEAAAGTAFGEVPVQRLWQVGGATTLRGYPVAAQRGESFWRARAELGTGLPLVRLTVFGDAAWAGPRDAFMAARPLRSAGIGLGLLDGLIRIDAARPLDAGGRWRLHMQINGIM